ncbi:hypothetical protein [Actinomadura nitritigenes]|uniref:hypothetical protein n=1 Tax=Actinomadura nitritigenes TaxID=134602 RepID=UPI003D92ECC7
MRTLPLLAAPLALALTACGSGNGSGSGAKPAAASPAAPASPSPAAPAPTKPDDGFFRYTVVKVRTTAAYQDNMCGGPARAQGEFTVITVKAVNLDRSPRQPASGKAFDDTTAWTANGKSFTEAPDLCTEGGDPTNPGQTARYDLVFDAPKGTRFTVLALTAHDAPAVAAVPVSG